MDTINFRLQLNKSLKIDGIDFSNTIFFRPIINGRDFISKYLEDDALAIASEWKKCILNNEKCLLFTSLIGIADEGGWEFCKVNKYNNAINILIPFNDGEFRFSFDGFQFVNELNTALKNLNQLSASNPSSTLEPRTVVFPEF
jgi:hypothetical protein